MRLKVGPMQLSTSALGWHQLGSTCAHENNVLVTWVSSTNVLHVSINLTLFTQYVEINIILLLRKQYMMKISRMFQVTT